MTNYEIDGGDQGPQSAAYVSFIEQYNQAVFGSVVGEAAIDVGGDEHFSDVKLLNVGVARVQFLDDLETGKKGLYVDFDPRRTGPEQQQIQGLYRIDTEEAKVFKGRLGFDRNWRDATEFELRGIANVLRRANELHTQAESERLPEVLQNQLKNIYEKILNGHSNHPLIKMSSFTGEHGTSIKSVIVDTGVHLELYRHYQSSGYVYNTIRLSGSGIPEELQSSTIVLDFDTPLFFAWDEKRAYSSEERLVYIGQKPAKEEEVETRTFDGGGKTLLTGSSAEYVIELLSRYESGEGFVIDADREAITPPTAEIRERLAGQLRRLVRGEIAVEGMNYTHEPDQKYLTRTASLIIRGMIKRKLKLLTSENQDGNCRIALGGLRVPDAIDNLEFRFNFSRNSFTVKRTLEDVSSFNPFKEGFLDSRQSYRIRKDYYTQDYMMSQQQARVLSEFLEQLAAGEIQH